MRNLEVEDVFFAKNGDGAVRNCAQTTIAMCTIVT